MSQNDLLINEIINIFIFNMLKTIFQKVILSYPKKNTPSSNTKKDKKVDK